MVKILHLS